VQALNDYSGAVILISHDRHMVELTADRLFLVDGGTAREYDGSMDDYIDFILGRKPKGDGVKNGGVKASGAGVKAPAAARPMAETRYARSQLDKAEKALARAAAEVERLDAQIVAASSHGQAGTTLQDLLARRARAADSLAAAEEAWLAAGAALEEIAAA
jgi:ATP-binding cassette subfamily F protein 3